MSCGNLDFNVCQTLTFDLCLPDAGSRNSTLHPKVPKKSSRSSSSGWRTRREGKARFDLHCPFCICNTLTIISPYSRFKMGDSPLTDFMGVETSKKRKRRTSFTPHALEILNSSFERNTHPSGKSYWMVVFESSNSIHILKARTSRRWHKLWATSGKWFEYGFATSDRRSKTPSAWCPRECRLNFGVRASRKRFEAWKEIS